MLGATGRRLQGQWRELTLHPADRLRAAFFSHASPAPDLMDPFDDRARRRLRLHSSAAAPPALSPDSTPALAELVILPALRRSAASQSAPRADGASPDRAGEGRASWPDDDPVDDVLLKL